MNSLVSSLKLSPTLMLSSSILYSLLVSGSGGLGSGSDSDNLKKLIRSRKSCFGRVRPVQSLLQLSPVTFADLRGVEGESSHRAEVLKLTISIEGHRGGGEGPAEGNSFGRLVDGCVRGLGRLSQSTVNDVDLVTQTVTLDVIADSGTVREPEHASRLLADAHARQDHGAVALSELIRVGVSLDGAAELLSRHQSKVLDVVCVNRRRLSAGRGSLDRGKTVPDNAVSVLLVRLVVRVENSVIDTSLVETLADLVEFQYSHGYSLKVECEHVMVQIFMCECGVELAVIKQLNCVRNLAGWTTVDYRNRILPQVTVLDVICVAI
nr:MAG TPA: hypothetical protein [Caudoviricetes sp.]